ncbi:transposase [Paenibacillus larvae]|nr:transposase [Paenibacillus larvae]MDT2294481.1 transposase [Paenibacillus larvae]
MRNCPNNRSLADSLFPFTFVDAMYLKVREDGRVRSRGIADCHWCKHRGLS